TAALLSASGVLARWSSHQFPRREPQGRRPPSRQFIRSVSAASAVLCDLCVKGQCLMRLWGGNYSGDPDRDFWEFNRSFPFDRRLVTEEIAASRAWVRALARCQAVTADEADRLDGALERLAQQ